VLTSPAKARTAAVRRAGSLNAGKPGGDIRRGRDREIDDRSAIARIGPVCRHGAGRGWPHDDLPKMPWPRQTGRVGDRYKRFQEQNLLPLSRQFQLASAGRVSRPGRRRPGPAPIRASATLRPVSPPRNSATPESMVPDESQRLIVARGIYQADEGLHQQYARAARSSISTHQSFWYHPRVAHGQIETICASRASCPGLPNPAAWQVHRCGKARRRAMPRHSVNAFRAG